MVVFGVSAILPHARITPSRNLGVGRDDNCHLVAIVQGGLVRQNVGGVSRDTGPLITACYHIIIRHNRRFARQPDLGLSSGQLRLGKNRSSFPVARRPQEHEVLPEPGSVVRRRRHRGSPARPA